MSYSSMIPAILRRRRKRLRSATAIALTLCLAHLTMGQTQAQPADRHLGGIALATIIQSNGNVLEFYSNPELEELVLWESGSLDRGGPAFGEDRGRILSMLERYLQLAPAEQAVPADLARFSRLSAEELEKLLRGRRLVDTIAEPIFIGDHMAAPPGAAAAACSDVGSGLDWGPRHRFSGCNVDATVSYMKARICNTSDWGSIRIRLGHKLAGWQHFAYPSYRTKDVGAGKYDYVAVTAGKLRRRAQYTNWSDYYEQAWVGGLVDGGSITVDNCTY